MRNRVALERRREVVIIAEASRLSNEGKDLLSKELETKLVRWEVETSI